MRTRSLCWVIVVVGLASCGTLGQERRVAINEIAWGGTVADRTDEWIELANTTGQDVSLAGWKLVSSDGGLAVLLSGTIQASSFLLLERADGPSAPTLHPSLTYHGALTDAGEGLWLIDSDGKVVDTANQEAGRWPAGTNPWGTPPCCSMERIELAMVASSLYAGTRRLTGGSRPEK